MKTLTPMNNPIKVAVLILLASAGWALGEFDRKDAASLQNAAENARLAQAVYRLDKTVEGGWTLGRHQVDDDGFKAAVYERVRADGRKDVRVVFAGSDDQHDWANNANQAAFLPLGILDRIEDQQFARAQAFAAGYANLAKTDKSIASLEAVGHSRGGAFVQAISGILDIAGMAFNSAALVKGRDLMTDTQVSTAERRVTQFSLHGDVVFPGSAALVGAVQLGRIFRVEPSVQIGGNPIDRAVASHDMRPMIQSLESKNPDITQRTLVHQDRAEVIVRDLAAIGKGCEELVRLAGVHRAEIGKAPFPLHLRLADTAAKELSSLRLVNELSGIANAIQADRQEYAGKPFALIRSQSLEVLASTALQGTSIPGLRSLPGAEKGFVGAMWEILDKNKMLPAQGKGSVGAPTFGAIEMTKAAANHVGRGRADIDTIETYLDGMVGMTWGVMGFVGSKGNLQTAERFQEYGQALVQSGRILLRDSGLEQKALRVADIDFQNQGKTMVEMYRFQVDRAVKTGSAVPSPELAFGGKGADAGLRAREIWKASGCSEKELSDIHQDATRTSAEAIKTVSISDSQATFSKSLQDARLAVGLARPEGKVVVFGSGPLADRTFHDFAGKLGHDKVKQVPVALSNYERNSIASDFGADTVVRVSQERYRVVTQNGYRQVIPNDTKPEIQRPTSADFTPPRVGGVMLRGAAEAGDKESQLTAGDFSLIFDGNKNELDVLGLRRFVTALWATYFTETGPGISIDPIGDGTEVHAVRYIGNVINSDLGRVMREADYLMKSWAVGVARPKVKDWMTPEDYAKKQGGVHLAGSRFWFVPEDMVFTRAVDENSLVFKSGRMVVKTEYLMDQEERAAIAKAKAEGKKPATASSENVAWAAKFSERYDELAVQSPVLGELFEYARQVSLAKYLKAKRIPLLWYMLANREMVITEDSPGTVEAFAKKSKLIENIKIYGGVDMQPSLSGGTFVLDEKLAAALRTVRSDAPPSSHELPTVQVVDAGKQSLTVAPSTSIVICDHAEGGAFATDLGLRNGKDPDLELARFRRQDLPQVQTFGRDWHILIPYSVHPASAKRIPYANSKIPVAMVLRNLLSGREETLRFDEARYKVAGYVPEDASGNINIGLFLLTDRTYRLADKLGCEYEFDRDGRLTEMRLAANYHVSYRYGEKKLGWRDFASQPYRLAAEGAEAVAVGNASVPRRLRLFDTATGEEEVFVFAPENAEQAVGYLPEKPDQSGYRFLAFFNQGSLLLKHRSGAEIEFDADGTFRHQVVDTLESMSQNSRKVAFKYEVVAGQYRIVSAAVSDAATSQLQHTVHYAYGDDGRLEESSVVSTR